MKPRYWIKFWIKSSRGTDECVIFTYPVKPSKLEVKSDLERWCSRFCAWSSSDNVVSYGWTPVKPVLKKVAKKRWQSALKRMFKAQKQSKLAAAFMQPYNIGVLQ